MERVAKHIDHVHARVGTTQSPQIADIRYHLRSNNNTNTNTTTSKKCAFANHWLMIKNAMVARGETEMTLTPEYGPMPYTPSYGGQPVSDVWEVTEASAKQLRDLLEE